MNVKDVTRVEVINHSPESDEPHALCKGRVYTNYSTKDVELSLQDDGRTLKIFLKDQ